MQTRSALAGLFISIFAVGTALANTADKAVAYPGTPASTQATAAAAEAKTREMKDILFKLVRQDEYLDESIETRDSRTAFLTAEDISAVSLSLKLMLENTVRRYGEKTALVLGDRRLYYANMVLLSLIFGV